MINRFWETSVHLKKKNTCFTPSQWISIFSFPTQFSIWSLNLNIIFTAFKLHLYQNIAHFVIPNVCVVLCAESNAMRDVLEVEWNYSSQSPHNKPAQFGLVEFNPTSKVYYSFLLVPSSNRDSLFSFLSFQTNILYLRSGKHAAKLINRSGPFELAPDAIQLLKLNSIQLNHFFWRNILFDFNQHFPLYFKAIF